MNFQDTDFCFFCDISYPYDGNNICDKHRAISDNQCVFCMNNAVIYINNLRFCAVCSNNRCHLCGELGIQHQFRCD